MDKFLVRNKKAKDLECETQHVFSQKVKRQTVQTYDEEYIKLGFVGGPSDITKPQCIVCYKTLSNENMKPAKLKRHLISPVALQLRAPPPKVSARAPAHRSYHFRGVKLKSCIKKIHHNLYISKQANVRIKHADTEGASHKKFGTDARVQ